MGQVVADVAEDAAREYGRGYIPIPEENGVCELVEWRGECNEERGWHD